MTDPHAYEHALVDIAHRLAAVAEALETEVTEKRCGCCDQRIFQPLDKSRALEQVHGMIEKLNRFAQASWVKTAMPGRAASGGFSDT
jgi:hypothetical protein